MVITSHFLEILEFCLDFKQTLLGNVDWKRIPRHPEQYQMNGVNPNQGFAIKDELEHHVFESPGSKPGHSS
jgi:hypothetical protein